MCRTTLFDINEQIPPTIATLQPPHTYHTSIFPVTLPTDPIVAANDIIEDLQYDYSDDFWALKTRLVNLSKATYLMSANCTPAEKERVMRDDMNGVLGAFNDLADFLLMQADKEWALVLVAALDDATVQLLRNMDTEKDVEEKRYEDNMTILYAQLCEKLEGDMEEIESYV